MGGRFRENSMPGTPVGTLADRIRTTGLMAGPVLGVLAYLFLPQAGEGVVGGLSDAGRATAGVGVLMAVWWLTEALPLAVTAIVPAVLFPLVGVMGVGDATAKYAHPLIGLFMGGFIVGLAMERSGVHRRLALMVLRAMGTNPKMLVAGFMGATAVLSMFLSNTATTIMLLPVCVSVIALVGQHATDQAQVKRWAACLVLSIAFGSSIGGMGTLIGTPPNLLLAAYLSEHWGVEIGFATWLKIGLPLVAVFLPLAWAVLVFVAFPVTLGPMEAAGRVIREELAAMGRPRWHEIAVFGVMNLVAVGWIFRGLIVEWTGLTGLTDTGVALGGALLLFMIPVDLKRRRFAMDWESAVRLPWGVLLLFGGGLALAEAIGRHGVDDAVGSLFLVMQGMPMWALVLSVAFVTLVMTHLTSNTAVAAAFLPVLGGASMVLGVDGMYLFVAAAMAASAAFMLPVATPPNAIVFGSGHVSMAEMVKAGAILNVVGLVLVTGVVMLLRPVLPTLPESEAPAVTAPAAP